MSRAGKRGRKSGVTKAARNAERAFKNRQARDRAHVHAAKQARNRIPNIREVIRFERDDKGNLVAVIRGLEEIKPSAGMGVPQSIRRFAQAEGVTDEMVRAALYIRQAFLACQGGMSASQTFSPDRVDHSPDPETRRLIEHSRRVHAEREFTAAMRSLGHHMHAAFWLICWPGKGIQAFCEHCRAHNVGVIESAVFSGLRQALADLARKIP